MRILVSEKLSEHKFKDNNGYLICTNCILSRTGAQTYRRNEVFNDGSDEEIEINRTADEVFSSEALASFENCPVCIEHPEVDVNPENHNELSVGFVRNVKKGTDNGEDVMLGDLVITDADAINLIESGEMTELSCGYNCDISDEETPQQLNIRGNHVALCEKGRAGIARIVDSIDDDDEIKVLKQKGTNALIWIKNAKLNPYVIVSHFEEKTKTWRNGTYYSDYEKAKKDFNKMYDSVDDTVRREGDFTIENEGDHYVIKRDGRKLLYAETEEEAIKMAHNGEAEEKYNEKTGKTKEDKYIIKATDVRGMYINQKGAGEYTHYSNAKRFDKRTAEAKVNAMNRSNGIHKWTIEKVNDSTEDNYSEFKEMKRKIVNCNNKKEVELLLEEIDIKREDMDLTQAEYDQLVKIGKSLYDSQNNSKVNYLSLEKKIKNAKNRSEVKKLMDEVDTHKDDGSLTKTEYLKLVKLSETVKDSITTHRIHSIINLIK